MKYQSGVELVVVCPCWCNLQGWKHPWPYQVTELKGYTLSTNPTDSLVILYWHNVVGQCREWTTPHCMFTPMSLVSGHIGETSGVPVTCMMNSLIDELAADGIRVNADTHYTAGYDSLSVRSINRYHEVWLQNHRLWSHPTTQPPSHPAIHQDPSRSTTTNNMRPTHAIALHCAAWSHLTHSHLHKYCFLYVTSGNPL